LGNYTWRIDLCKTEKHWPGWFQGLSKKFLSIHAQKLLLLANIDRMDKDLTVGQMQGTKILYKLIIISALINSVHFLFLFINAFLISCKIFCVLIIR
jgi:protein phosphatase methylesterase 1